MGFKVKANYTPKRHEWLTTLHARPGTRRPSRSHTAHSCMTLGYTMWIDRSFSGECLTPLGLATLKRWDKQKQLTASSI
jgi:hypothetical protein